MSAEWSSSGEEKFECVPNCTDSYRDLYICSLDSQNHEK